MFVHINFKLIEMLGFENFNSNWTYTERKNKNEQTYELVTATHRESYCHWNWYLVKSALGRSLS